LHAALLLSVCLLFYKLLLQTETFYQLNRWILMSCLALSFLLPLVQVPGRWSMQEAPQVQARHTQEQVFVSRTLVQDAQPVAAPGKTKAFPAVTVKSLPDRPSLLKAVVQSFHIVTQAQIIHWLFVIYWAGVAVFGLNLLIQLFITLYQAYTRPAIFDGPYRIIELTGNKVPCSFLNNIFINPEKYDWETYSQILSHEKVHVKQLHSLDIFLAELAIVFQWFNPFAWLYRKEVENNIEYLTDEEVLNAYATDKESYQVSLLKVSTPHFSLRIATNYNQSLLKKRIMMMNAKKSNLHTLWKYFMLLPLFGGLACALNTPAISKNLIVKNKINKPVIKSAAANEPIPNQNNFPDETEGSWFGIIRP
ncbi:MAG: M56 family metallopeptidase, partial [Hymenobacter sp.]